MASAFRRIVDRFPIASQARPTLPRHFSAYFPPIAARAPHLGRVAQRAAAAAPLRTGCSGPLVGHTAACTKRARRRWRWRGS
jgi:hypothetical protein